MTVQHQTKTAYAQFKAVEGVEGTFEAIVSVFGNIDLGGDRVMPGAFSKSLEEWKAKGDPIPVIWSHEWDDPESHIGLVVDAQERPEGLWVKAQLDVEHNQRAAYVARLLKDRRVTQFSFGYHAREYQFVTDTEYGQVRELTDIHVFEVGPTLLGMNPATQLLEAASLVGKAGRVLSSKNETALSQARDLIDGVLKVLQQDDTGKSTAVDEQTGEVAPEAAPDAPATDVQPDTELTTTDDKPAVSDTTPTITNERLAELLIEIR